MNFKFKGAFLLTKNHLKLTNKKCQSSLLSVFLVLVLAGNVYAQFPHPVPQSLPYSENFNTSLSSATTTTYPAGWRAYKIGSAAPSSGGRTGNPTADYTALTASGTAASSGSGPYNFTGKLGFLSTASIDMGMVLSLNTTSQSSVKLNFDLMTIRNPYDGSVQNDLQPYCKCGGRY